MIIKPKVRGFMCTTAHPVGCRANVARQIEYVTEQGKIESSVKNVLIIGSSTGYGLASRISAAFGCGAGTLGIFFEKAAAGKRTASAGWYNTAAFHELTEKKGVYTRSINGDAFSNELKEQTINIIKEDMGQVDLVVYSLAAPRREHPETGTVHTSTLKPIGKEVTQKGINTDKEIIQSVTLPAASQDEIDNTVAVMGGEDWEMWIKALGDAGVLSENCKTTAYTYLGDKVTHDIYWDGTIGAAKKDLDRASASLNKALEVKAYVSVLKAVVTQASSAIPIMPLYLALLFKVMKEAGSHEGCIEQVYGLFKDGLCVDTPVLDKENRLRRDGEELKRSIQAKVEELWPQVTTENLAELTDFEGYKTEFLKLFGFEMEGVDYEADVDADVAIPGL